MRAGSIPRSPRAAEATDGCARRAREGTRVAYARATRRLLACTAALAKAADVVERAAAVLAHTRTPCAAAASGLLPGVLGARRGGANGVTDTARDYLDTVHRRIPFARRPRSARTVEAPSHAGAAKQNGKAMLAAMQYATFDKANLRRSRIEAQTLRTDTAAPYTIYADWLQTRGDARGQWIRCTR